MRAIHQEWMISSLGSYNNNIMPCHGRTHLHQPGGNLCAENLNQLIRFHR